MFFLIGNNRKKPPRCRGFKACNTQKNQMTSATFVIMVLECATHKKTKMKHCNHCLGFKAYNTPKKT